MTTYYSIQSYDIASTSELFVYNSDTKLMLYIGDLRSTRDGKFSFFDLESRELFSIEEKDVLNFKIFLGSIANKFKDLNFLLGDKGST